jgi:TRAP-type C4-dicarboxylate transport system substrate-binding protein
MAKGVVDGGWCCGIVLAGRNWGEVIKHVVSNVVAQRQAVFTIMNWDTYNKLPKDIQDIIDDMSGPEYTKFYNDAWYDGEVEGMEIFLKEMDGKIYEFSNDDLAKLQRNFDKVIEEWETKLEAQGLPSKEVNEKFRELQKKYSQPFPY